MEAFSSTNCKEPRWTTDPQRTVKPIAIEYDLVMRCIVLPPSLPGEKGNGKKDLGVASILEKGLRRGEVPLSLSLCQLCLSLKLKLLSLLPCVTLFPLRNYFAAVWRHFRIPSRQNLTLFLHSCSVWSSSSPQNPNSCKGAST